MVKFSKELEAQLIPEWKHAFVNYWELKKHVKKIKILRKAQLSSSSNYPGGLDHQYSPFHLGRFICHPFRRVAGKFSDKLRSNSDSSIQEKSINAGEDEDEGDRETELVQLFSEEDEVKKFMDKLDDELEKVNEFYQTKEMENIERWEDLDKNLRILLEVKQIFKIPRPKNNSLRSSNSVQGSTRWSQVSSPRTSDFSGDVSDANSESAEYPSQTEEVISILQRNGVKLVGAENRKMKKTASGKLKTSSFRIDIPSVNPARTISASMSMLWEDLINIPKKNEGNSYFIRKKKIQCAEKTIRAAYVEFYRGLSLLNTYSTLNMVAFTKIMKKFDKVANRQASGEYLKNVKRSHFISSDKVVRLMDEVEFLFTKHFADNDRKKAMKYLRPQQQKDSHVVTFLVGLLTGCFVTLFTVYAILAHLSGMFSPGSKAMETVYPVFSIFALLSLHLFMYGCNLFMWKATRINYSFIFEFNPKTCLKYRDAFLLCTSFMTAVVVAMVLHLLLKSNGLPATQVDAVPGFLLLIFIAVIFCPFNIIYRPTRYCFLRVLRNIVFSPFSEVLMVDFFMADQLTSQISLLRHVETAACYFLAGSFKTHQFETCHSGKLYRQLAYVISFAPYYWRAMQCARRWFDESDPKHLYNLGKYLSAMVAAGCRLTYAGVDNHLWLIIVIVTSAGATMYQLYWDFVMDWHLLNPHSRNPWLRDNLILKNNFIYYISIAVNVVLRITWVEAVMRFNIGSFQSRVLEFSLASLEVIRRGHWNFYRLENEHLNNVGHFRAVKNVPLPFRETDSDG